MRQPVLFGFAFFVIATASGQDRMVSRSFISISVLDSMTRLPIPDVHVSIATGGDISDEKGKVNIWLSPGDVISLTHINYRAREIMYSEAMGTDFIVALNQNVRVLPEIRITDIQSEEAMKRKILETDAAVSKGQAVVSENSVTINKIVKVAPTPAPTHAEQFFESLEGTRGVTILSTRGGGLIKAIKNITNPKRLRVHTPVSDYRSDPAKITPFKVKLISVDSVVRDSTTVKESVINPPE